MDTELMRAKLEHYFDLCENYRLAYRNAGFEYTDQVRGFHQQATRAEPTIRQILHALDPALDADLLGPGYESGDPEGRVLQALGILSDRDEWPAMLAPDAPSLTADELHPLIWSAAAPLWDTGEYKMAAQQASVNLSVHIKARVGSHLNERELVQQVFAPELPRPGQSRLHLPGDREDKNWKSAQTGLHLIAQGAFAGIRNIAAHGPEQWTEHEALEHLAVLSVVARWADLTVELTAEPESAS